MSDFSYQEKKLRLQLLIEERNLVDSLISSEIADGNTTSIQVKEKRRKELDNEIKKLQLEIPDILPSYTTFLFVKISIILVLIALICFKFAVDRKNENADDYSSETASAESTSTTVVLNLESAIEAPTRTPKLSNSPVEITPEVDNYFKIIVANLKGAMSVDQVIGANDLWDNVEAQKNFKEAYEEWKGSLIEVEVPLSCVEFHEMYESSIEGYVLYFNSIEEGLTQETSIENYASKIKETLTTVQNNTAKYEDLAEDYFVVFNYYGLYSGQ